MNKQPAVITNSNIHHYLAEKGAEPEAFRVVELVEYRDTMNDGVYEHFGRKFHVVPAELADEAVSVRYDFTHTGIYLLNEKDEKIGEKTVGIGYDDILVPTILSVEELLYQLEKMPQ